MLNQAFDLGSGIGIRKTVGASRWGGGILGILHENCFTPSFLEIIAYRHEH